MKAIQFLTSLLLLACLNVLSGAEEQKHWAFLVAGSRTWMNYRHQADVCHSYHIMRRHGIPAERIVVMMYDDIADNEQNPKKGAIYNRPNGPNVYPGVSKDYTGTNVNPQTFLNVLSGDETGVKKLTGKAGKVIKSGANDTVFVYFSDHGAPGLIAFPHNNVLYARDLNDTLTKMHENKQYKQLVFYVEACNSGSMFKGILKKDINIFVTTAANPDESSYACYWDSALQTFLGDLYSVNWMQDSEAEDLSIETLQQQFVIVKEKTNKSHVMEYGDLKMKTRLVGDFQGNLTDTTHFLRSSRYIDPNLDAVKAEDVELEILKHKLADAKGDDEVFHLKRAILTVLTNKRETVGLFKRIVHLTSGLSYDTLFSKSVNFSDFTCYTKAIDSVIHTCPGLTLTNNYYALKNLGVLANLCEAGVSAEDLSSAIELASARSSICVL